MNFLQLANETEKHGIDLDLYATEDTVTVTLTDSKTGVPVSESGETVEQALAKIVSRLTWRFL